MLFLDALGRRRDLRRVTLRTGLTLIPPDFVVQQCEAVNRGEMPNRNLVLSSVWVGPGEREGASARVVEVIPSNAREIAQLLEQRRFDAVVVGSSGIDEEGNFNLSCNVDWMPDILAVADQLDALVIVEVNKSLPWTEGETTFPIEVVDCVLESTRPIPDLPAGAAIPEAQAIGGFLTELIPDGATLHVGLGDLVSQSVAALECKRDLGVHSDVLSDVLLHLERKEALSCRKKGFMDGKWVGSFVLGSRQLMDFVDRNPAVSLHSIQFVAEPANIMRNNLMCSVTQASCVDLFGQVAAQGLKFEFTGNGGLQHTFHVASAKSSGMGIVLLCSAFRGGQESNIVASLPPGTMVSIPAPDTDCVVTEQGVARLKGRSLRERAASLIAIAHPAHRESLAAQARKFGLI